jgi:hypothetical protein
MVNVNMERVLQIMYFKKPTPYFFMLKKYFLLFFNFFVIFLGYI